MLTGIRRVPRDAPLHPRVVGDRGGKLCLLPRAVIDLHLDAGYPDVLLPRHARDDGLAGGHGDARAGHIDTGLQLDGAEFRPAARGPVALGLIEPRDLEIDDPLGGRYVSVEPGYDHPHRKAVLGRKGLAVHADGENRIAIVSERLQWRPRGEPIDRRRQHHVGIRRRASPGEQLADGVTQPYRVADEVTADVVRDARECRRALIQRQREQFVPGEFDLFLDHAVDAKTPRRRIDLRNHQGSVDAVEVGVRRDEGRDPLDVELGARGYWRGGRRGRRQLQRVAHGRHRSRPAACDVSGDCRNNADRGCAAHPHECLAAARSSVGIRVGGLVIARRTAPQYPDEVVQRKDRNDACDDRGKPSDPAGIAAGEGDDSAHDTERAENDQAPRGLAQLQDAGHSRQQHEDDSDARQQSDLVVRPEQGDREVLAPRRRGIDDRPADDGERAGCRSEQDRREFSQARTEDRRGGSCESGDGGVLPASGVTHVPEANRVRRGCGPSVRNPKEGNTRATRPRLGSTHG